MSRTIALLVCFLFNAAACLAQSVGGQLQSYQADLTLAKKTEAESQARREAVKNLVNARFHPQRFVLFAMGYDEVLLQQMLSLWDQSRVDKQIGSTATGSASTDLVSLPSTPELFGLAMTLGALTQSVSGSVATFRGTPTESSGPLPVSHSVAMAARRPTA